MDPRINILPLPTSANALLGGRLSGYDQGTFLSLGWETILEDGWTTNCSMDEDVKKKQINYRITISPERNWNFTSRNKEDKWILFHMSRSAINQSILIVISSAKTASSLGFFEGPLPEFLFWPFTHLQSKLLNVLPYKILSPGSPIASSILDLVLQKYLQNFVHCHPIDIPCLS